MRREVTLVEPAAVLRVDDVAVVLRGADSGRQVTGVMASRQRTAPIGRSMSVRLAVSRFLSRAGLGEAARQRRELSVARAALEVSLGDFAAQARAVR